jgi:hypothetical protein
MCWWPCCHESRFVTHAKLSGEDGHILWEDDWGAGLSCIDANSSGGVFVAGSITTKYGARVNVGYLDKDGNAIWRVNDQGPEPAQNSNDTNFYHLDPAIYNPYQNGARGPHAIAAIESGGYFSAVQVHTYKDPFFPGDLSNHEGWTLLTRRDKDGNWVWWDSNLGGQSGGNGLATLRAGGSFVYSFEFDSGLFMRSESTGNKVGFGGGPNWTPFEADRVSGYVYLTIPPTAVGPQYIRKVDYRGPPQSGLVAWEASNLGPDNPTPGSFDIRNLNAPHIYLIGQNTESLYIVTANYVVRLKKLDATRTLTVFSADADKINPEANQIIQKYAWAVGENCIYRIENATRLLKKYDSDMVEQWARVIDYVPRRMVVSGEDLVMVLGRVEITTND